MTDKEKHEILLVLNDEKIPQLNNFLKSVENKGVTNMTVVDGVAYHLTCYLLMHRKLDTPYCFLYLADKGIKPQPTGQEVGRAMGEILAINNPELLP